MTVKRIDFQVPQEHPCYEAHFPGNPIVPGALLLQWIADHACDLFGPHITGVKSMKFMESLKPNDCCVLEFNSPGAVSDHEEMVIKVCCMRDDTIICKGTLLSTNKLMDGM